MTETPNPHIVDADTLSGDMRPLQHCVVALGSNMGDRLAKLQAAVDALADTPDVWVSGVSSVYETEPVDAPAGSGPFLNAVVVLDTTLPPALLLDRVQAIESAYGRKRDGVANAPRPLDVDLVVVGDRVMGDERLVLPHPRAAGRAFVLAPWADLEPDGDLPGAGRVADLLEQVGREGVVRRDDLSLEVR
jgi:2-amino-4-hydroxy-6-hydroxymethyldihydropteridine diphosphokinase